MEFPHLGVAMSQSPQRPYSLETATGKIRIWGGDGDGDTDPNDDAGSGDAGSGDNHAEETEEAKRLKELEKEHEDLKKKHKEEKKRADDAEKKVNDKAKEGMEQAEKDAAERDEYKEKYEKLLAFVETEYLTWQISKVSQQQVKAKDGSMVPRFQWQDVNDLTRHIDKSAINIDMDNGQIDGLEAQLKDLAKAKPYLLVPQGDSAGGGEYKPPAGPVTGNQPAGGQVRKPIDDRQKLGTKYKFGHLIPGLASAGR